ncbi:glycolate oxidase subunit GlcE [Mariprofundus ferrooxydans]|uniref:glycolate oxidase subunit GlcE n=1 Tax=Mariprofundus ferrooxydans TaxID=314344 RepID=UPI001431CDDE|nr:glycolate oxidase subunit GlcE [Mariprofundus ferrooxydans]
MQADRSNELREHVAEAYARQTPLCITSSGSKAGLGRPVNAAQLEVAAHRGVTHHEPTELVLTARAGTPLAEIEQLLAAHDQMLPFEPPHLGESATLGGSIACNLSGPRRPYTGAVRDFVLGCRIINGKGEVLHFGGEVMKNVAGYDASRLMAGAQGTLGVLLDISLKVLPVPACEITMVRSCSAAEALQQMNRLAGQPLPLSASAWVEGVLYLRFSGSDSAMLAIPGRVPGEVLGNAEARSFWLELRERQLPFFMASDVWRIALPQAAAQPSIAGRWLLEWGGAQRWLHSDAPVDEVQTAAAALGGHATLLRRGEHPRALLHPLAPELMHVHRRLKQAFDPAGILNPGRLYEEL